MRAQEIGHPRVIQTQVDVSLAHAAQLMHHHQIGCLVVTMDSLEGAVPVGMLTHRDIVLKACAASDDLSQLTVGDVMSAPAVCCRTDHTIDELVSLMHGSGARRLPMLDDAGRLAGIVCSNDVLEAIGELLTALSQAKGIGGRQDRLEI